MKRLIVDTGIWYACYDKSDANHQYADKILGILRTHSLIIPFPTLYETINTRFVKNNYGQMNGLRSFLENPSRVHLVDDAEYKQRAMDAVLSKSNQGKSYSLVDMIIRLMMEDVKLGPVSVLTFNVGDFININNVEVISPAFI